jgi:predicted ArsR family transcriptional regulator
MTKRYEKWTDAEAFVKAWQQAENLDAAAKKLGVEPTRASIQATYLRKRGVPLRKFAPPGRPTKDYEALKALARKLAPRSAQASSDR